MAKEKILDPIRSKYLAGPGRARDLDACDVYGKVRILRVEAAVPESVEADTIMLGNLPGGHSLFLGYQSLIEVSAVPEGAEIEVEIETAGKDGKVTKTKEKQKELVTFSVGHGPFDEPMGERFKTDYTAFVETKPLRECQTLLGKLDSAKVKCVAPTEVVMKTSVPLKAGTVVRGYLAFSHD